MAFGLKGETNLKSKDVEERFNDIINSDKFVCTESEFDDFQNYGYILSVGDRYLTKMGKTLNIDIIKSKASKMNIDLSELVSRAINVSDEVECKRVYCMNKTTYDHYNQLGYIVHKDGADFYRYIDNEMWYIMLI